MNFHSYHNQSSSDDSILQKPPFNFKEEHAEIDRSSSSISDIYDNILLTDLVTSLEKKFSLPILKKKKCPYYIGTKLYIPMEEWSSKEIKYK